MGHLLAVKVTGAHQSDQEGARGLCKPLKEVFPTIKLVWGDSHYGGSLIGWFKEYKKGGFIEWVKETFGWEVEVVEHPWSGQRGVWAPKDAVIDWEQIRPRGFHVLKWRWIVERTFAWLSTWRRLAKDYEVLPSSEEAWIYLAMIRLMVRRLAQNSF